MSNPDVETLISERSEAIAEKARKEAESAGSEEDVRHAVNKEIDRFIADAGLRYKGRHEYGLAGGAIDSKYAGVIVEYKNPNGSKKITGRRRSAGCTEVVSQIEERFEDFREHEEVSLERIFGVGTDGRHILFARHRNDSFEIDGPQPVTPVTVDRLLRALVSSGAQGKAYTPENLARDFGAPSDTARHGVQAFLDRIRATEDSRVQMLFDQWRILFTEVCGYDAVTQSDKVDEIADLYAIAGDPSPAELLFAVHSYYALLIKLLAAEAASRIGPIGTSQIKKCVSAPSDIALHRAMEDLEEGGIWAKAGIRNFLEGDLFSWYLEEWEPEVVNTVRALARTLDAYDPGTLSVDPQESRDLLKDLYQELLPRSVRHDLGEYYTPDWLAARVLDEVGYDGNPDARLLDPACGSGTFLVLAINRVRDWYREHRHEAMLGKDDLIEKILRNIVGFDLNPLAALAARTNYLLAIRDLLHSAGEIELPVYLCDSILVPSQYGSLFKGHGRVRRLRTATGEFFIPTEIAQPRERIGQYADILEHSVLNDYEPEDFITYVESEGLPITSEQAHRELYERLTELHANRQDSLWARIIKNAFAPLFTDPFDFVAGNPPWVNWESLPDQYRSDTEDIWSNYRLFPVETRGKRQASRRSKTDISILMTYVSLDRYTTEEGRLGFLITQSVWQSETAGRHFRRFELPKEVPFRVEEVHDYLDVKPFEGASSPTSLMVLQKGEETVYPVDYPKWRRTQHGRIPSGATPEQANAATERLEWKAYPIRKKDDQSSWLVGRQGAIEVARELVGASPYADRVREGANTRGRNGIFYVRTDSSRIDGEVIITNDEDAGRKDVDVHEENVEVDYLYPILRGRDVRRWAVDFEEDLALVLPHDEDHTANPIPEGLLRRNSPKLYGFLKKFENSLRNRRKFRNFDPSSGPFYGLYNVGTYSFSEYKVIWREIASDFIVAPVGKWDHPRLGEKVVMCNHKLMQVPVASWEEALYLAAMLNSSVARYTVLAYTVSTQISTHVLEHVQIPRYERSKQLHQEIVERASECHNAAKRENQSEVSRLEDEIDDRTARIWRLSVKELNEIKKALQELI